MSEDKDNMHLAELEQDVLGEPLTHLEESAMQNTIKLTIENKRLRARIKELEHEVKALSEITETDIKCFVEAFQSKGEA